MIYRYVGYRRFTCLKLIYDTSSLNNRNECIYHHITSEIMTFRNTRDAWPRYSLQHKSSTAVINRRTSVDIYRSRTRNNSQHYQKAWYNHHLLLRTGMQALQKGLCLCLHLISGSSRSVSYVITYRLAFVIRRNRHLLCSQFLQC